MVDSILNCQDIDKADVLILTAAYDRTASLGKGARNGGFAIVKCLHADVEFFDRYSLTQPCYIYKIAHKDLGVSNDLLPQQMVEKICAAYYELMKKEKLLMLLGGEHSVSIGAFRAISKKRVPENITIFHIDAHCDLRNDDSDSNPDPFSVSKFAHSCVMRRAYEMGFHIVQVGIRSYSKEEYDFFTANDKITVFEWGKGKEPSIDKIILSVGTDKVYISLDVDGIDPAHMPATGTPVPGGLEWYYTIELLRELIARKEIIGADIVEVAPRENDYLTQYSAARLCYHIIGNNLLKKKPPAARPSV